MKEKDAGCIRVLAVGDIIGRPGRKLLKQAKPLLTEAWSVDLWVVNVENAAGGFGMTADTYTEFLKMGITCMTSGNHIYDKKGYESWMGKADHLIRPENLPPGSVGKGWMIVNLTDTIKVGVINIMGRTFMKPYDCPFRAVDTCIETVRAETPIVLVDFHAEATSEKMAMGHYCAGRVSAVWGTHTHVPTADYRLFGKHTGYITDLGMTGAYDSVIGMKKEAVIEGFQTLNRNHFEVAEDDPRLGGCLFDIEPESGACRWLQGVLISQAQIQELAAESS